MKAGTLEIELLTNLAKLQSEMEQIKRSVGGMESDVSRKTRAANDNLASLSNTAKLGKHHIQNLAFQFQDLGVQLASAAGSSAPLKMTLMALFQQGTQISGVMAQAGIGVKGLVTEVAAMAAPFIPAIAAISAMAGGIALVTDEINSNSKVTVTWTDTVLGAYDVVRDYVSSKLTAAFAHFGTSTGDVWNYVKAATKGAVNFIIGATSAVPNFISATWRLIGPAMGDAFYSGVNLVADALQAMLDKAASAVNGVTGFFNNAFGTSIPQVVTASIPKIANPYAGAMTALGSAGAKSLVGSFTKDYISDFADAVSGAAQKRAYERLAKDAKDGGKTAGKSAAKAIKDETDKLWEQVIQDARDFAKNLAKALAGDLKTGLAQMQDEIARGTSDWLQAANDNAKATANWNAELQDTIRLLDQLGGFGQTLGNIGAIFEAIGSGNWTNVNGPLGIIGKSLGGVLNNSYVTGMDDNGRWIKSLGEVLTQSLDKVFGGQGSFTKTLQAAGVGMAAGQLVNGRSNSGIGSAIGGVLGEVAGKAIGKAVGGTLGKALGPLGSIAGGILGGALGGLFKTVQSGYAQVRDGTVAGTYGRTGDLQAGAAASAGGIVSQINAIAAALGVKAGSYDFDIGKKDNKYVLNTGARGVFNFDTEAQAIEAALREAVADGAFNGISDGAKRLLQGSGDFQGQLTKAVTFQNVFAALQEKTDPLGYSLSQIDKQFTNLKAIFQEAGATAGEYAQLEKLISIQRQAVIDEDAADKLTKLNERRSLEVRLMEAQGKTTAALALQRQIETSETDASLRALLSQIYAAEDLARAQQAAAQTAEALAAASRQIASERSGIEEKLLQLQGNTAALRERELAALDPSNRALQKQVYALEDAQAAQNALAQATEQAQSRFKSFADQLRGFADDLTGTGGAASYTGSRAQLMATAALASAGNEDALGKLTGVSQAFLDVAKKQAATAADYQREVAFVRGYINNAIAAADGGSLTGLAGASGTPAQIAAANAQVNASLLTEMQAMRAEVAAARAEARAANESLVISNNKIMRLQERWDRGGSLAVVTDADRPLKTQAA